jgi:pyrroline-5-carboxylate reductase
MKLSFIGGGKMAEAIIHGVLAGQLADPGDIVIGEPVAERRAFLSGEFGVMPVADNLEAVDGADLTVLAVKPQDLGLVLGELRGSLKSDQAALSIVAGARMDTLSQGLNHGAVVRVMPNTPAQVGSGMTLWTCSDGVSDDQRAMTRAVLSSVGEEIYVSDEKYMDMATALSASGPAYVFLFIEALIDAGVYIGMPREMARTLALQTVYGSTKLVMETGRHPAELKDMVVSPAGTTAEALRVLEEQGVPAALVAAVDAAYKKSVQLGQG